MKLKTFVGIVLAASVFLIGSIILFGAVSTKAFLPTFLVFALAIVGISIIITSKAENKWDTIYVAVIAIVFTIFLSTFASALKEVYEVNNQVSTTAEFANQELDASAQKIKYFQEFSDYLENEIANYKKKNAEIEKQVEDLKKKTPNISTIVTPTPVPEPIPEIIPKYYYEDDEDEEEEEDDD